MVESGRLVETTSHCLVREDVYPINIWQKVVRVSNTELGKSILNDCNEEAVEYLVEERVPPDLDSTSESITCEKNDGQCDLGDLSSYSLESEAIGEDSAEEIEEFHPLRGGTEN